MAEYAILLYTPFTEGQDEATPEEFAAHERHREDLERSGRLRAAFALEPVTTATSIRGGVVTDGPFVEAKEVVAGVYVIEAADLDAALEVARRNPILQQGGGLEVRPVVG